MSEAQPPSLDTLIAHSGSEQNGYRTQPLREHLENVAELAAEFAAPFASEAFAAWLGWWHDAGKAAADVQAYLNDEDATSPSPDHSSAGMLRAMQVLEPLAFNVAGHHGGLSDQGDLRKRIQRKQQEGRVTAALALAEELLVDQVSGPTRDDLPAFLQEGRGQERRRRVTFWLRMLHACLVDADCLDTEAHFDPEKARRRGGEQVVRPAHWEAFERDQQKLTARAEETAVNAARRQIYRACLEAAEKAPGVFSLTVPTGGGKTRSAMAFALRHALRHGKRRVVVALPYTSIIEQNAKVYRDIFGAEAVLEHHSALRKEDAANEPSEEERRRRLAAQNWSAPIVVTTTVQLLESLFSNQNKRCRKLHCLAESVVILDEVQTLPPKLLRPTLEALQHLVDCYGVTLLLCTATPPALRSREGFEGLRDVCEIIRKPKTLYRALRRVHYEVRAAPMPWEEVAAEMREAGQALTVCNTTADAQALLAALPETGHVFHLSARMCPAHRQHVLRQVKTRLGSQDPQPVLLVSTQCIECGVDVDFPRVFRAVGPLDSIIQAAGRCNREGKLVRGHVTIFEPEEGGPLPPEAYKTGTDETRVLLGEEPPLDFHDPAVSLRYFRRLYQSSDTDKKGIQAKLEEFQFEQAGRAYRLIDDDSVPVVVRYEPAREKVERVLKALRYKDKASGQDYRALQPYTVNVRMRKLREAASAGHCREVASDLWVWEGAYDEKAGLRYGDSYAAEELVW